MYMEDSPENLVTPPNGQNHPLKYHLQLKTKDDVGDGE